MLITAFVLKLQASSCKPSNRCKCASCARRQSSSKSGCRCIGWKRFGDQNV